VPYSEVINDPLLYNEVYVIWRGKAANVITADAGTGFDFMIGYDSGSTLEGIVPVVFNKAVNVNPDRPIEVLGRIVPAGPEGPIRLEGVSIHQL
jgi:hypothetical protein